ncbi:MAG: hypothetical protein JSS75_09615 [Bacteroidetes bacterium]|nr:hypothetical protein [Bacteroidota bacterium]
MDKLKIECAHDQGLRDRMVKNPAAVLQERGIEVPAGVKVNVVQDAENTHTITLPPYVGSDLAAATMAKASNSGTWWCTTCTATTPICAGSLASLTCI